MTSSSRPSSAAAVAASIAVFTIGPYASTVTSVPSRTTREANSGSGVASVSSSPFSQYRRLGSRKTIGSSAAMACWIIQYASTGLEQATTLSPAVCAKYASGLSLWCSTAPMPPPNGIRITIGMMHPAAAAEVQLRDLADDLVVGRVDEAVELDLAHRPIAAHRQPDRGAEDAGLGERGIDHPVLTEVLLQPVGDPEDTAELADVLAHHEDLRSRPPSRPAGPS